MMPGALGDLAKYTLLVVGALFPIVNPIGNPARPDSRAARRHRRRPGRHIAEWADEGGV